MSRLLFLPILLAMPCSKQVNKPYKSCPQLHANPPILRDDCAFCKCNTTAPVVRLIASADIIILALIVVSSKGGSGVITYSDHEDSNKDNMT